jgi:hypothetical protein
MGWAEVLKDLAAARKDPQARWKKVKAKIEQQHATGQGSPKDPLWLRLDKPWDDGKHPARAVASVVEIPPLDSLTHDADYFAAVKASPLHGKRLDGLREYYRRH